MVRRGIVEILHTNTSNDGVQDIVEGGVQVEVPLPVPVPKNESHLRPNSRDLGFGCLIFLAVAFGFT